MKQLLDDLISKAPIENKGAIQAQVALKNGQSVAGAIRHYMGDVYEVTSVGQKRDEMSQVMVEIPVRMYVRVEDIFTVAVEAEVEMPSIITPGGNGISVPGRA